MVAAHSRTAKGKLPTGAGRLPIPVHDPCSNLVDELLVTIFVAAKQTSREPISRIVGFLDRGIKVFDTDYIQQRAEQLFIASVGNFCDVDQAR